MTHAPIRFGLIGSGRIGQVHARSIASSPEAHLAAVADPFVNGARALAATYGGTATDDARELFDPRMVDALLVASPTPTHIELIEAAVDAGIPVLCEKPIDLDLARVNGIRDKVRASDVPVAIGFNRRFDPGFAAAHARLTAGDVGTLEQLTIISRDPAAPPDGYLAVSGGIFRDMTIHDFDMARFFAPDIVEVSAIGTTNFDPNAREIGDFDTAVTTLRTSSGALITIINSRHSAVGYDQRMEVFGPHGLISVANKPTSWVTHSTASAVGGTTPFEPSFLTRYAESYANELAEFIRLVRGVSSSSPTFEDGRAALVLADAAQRSATEHVAVTVDLG